MSSDYIERLRAELLRADARRRSRWRMIRFTRFTRPLTAVAAAALVAAAIVLAVPGERSDEKAADATVQLTYRFAAGDVERSAEIVRARLAAAGISPAIVSTSSGGLTIAVPRTAQAKADALLQPGELAIYDWEGGVLGPDGKTAPDDPAVTGGADAGRAATTSKTDAQARAAGHEDARVVEALGDEEDRWFALAGRPALTNADVASARVAADRPTREPVVAIELTPAGRDAFTQLTRTIAQRGADNALGQDPLITSHHLAIVVDDRILSVPFVNWQVNPDGIDGGHGVQISGGLTSESARQLAALLSAGPLP